MRRCNNRYQVGFLNVSISDEKPLHMRPCLFCARIHRGDVSISDEKPLHMRPQDRVIAALKMQVVSISDEKPPHMRRLDKKSKLGVATFQSQTRSRSTCDVPTARSERHSMLRFK